MVGVQGIRASFDYFKIKDQNNVIWFWWISRAGELSWSLSVPSLSTRVAHEVVLSPIPNWLQLGTDYVLPAILTGEPFVRSTVPPVGAGMVGSPTVRGQASGSWQLTVNVTDEIVPVLV